MSKNEQAKVTKKKEEQLKLGLRQSPLNYFYKLRDKLYLRFKAFEAKRYFRDPAIWFFISLSITGILVQATLIQTFYSTLPRLVPLLQLYIPLEQRLITKQYLVALPIGSILVAFIAVYLSSKLFSQNKQLSTLMFFYATISIAMTTFTLIKLLSFYYV